MTAKLSTKKLRYHCGITVPKLNDSKSLGRIFSCLGCKGSWVQIPPVRPIQLLNFTYNFDVLSIANNCHAFQHSGQNLSYLCNKIAVNAGRPLAAIFKPLAQTISAANFHSITAIQKFTSANSFQKFSTWGGDMGAFKGVVYKITVHNWDKYNQKKKKGHECIMLSTGFLTDAKIRQLTPVTRLLFLSCLLVAGESAQSQIEVSHESLVFQSGVKSGSLQSQLDLLQSLQLVTYEKIELLIEKKRKEEKRKEKKLRKGDEKSEIASQPPESAAPAIAAYCDLWRARYKTKTSPTILPKDAKLIKGLVKQVGTKKAIMLIEAYLKMPDSWFVTKRHDIPTLNGNLNSVTQFMESGRMITKSEIRQLDNAVTNQQTLDALKAGEI